MSFDRNKAGPAATKDTGSGAADSSASPRPFSMPRGYWEHYGVQPSAAAVTETVLLKEETAAQPAPKTKGASPKAGGDAATQLRQAAETDEVRAIPNLSRYSKAYGMDLTGVRAFAGGAATREALGSLHARGAAFRDQVFFESESPDEATVAHEVAHVVQMRGGSPASSKGSGAAGGKTSMRPTASAARRVGSRGELEAEADQASARAVRGEDVEIRLIAPGDLPLLSVATYTAGAPAHPSIHHDNGFLDAFAPRPATWSDQLQLAEWVAKLEIAEAIRPDLVDATAAYRHFVYGNGADRQFSYERYVANDASGAATLQAAVSDAEQGAESVFTTLPAGTTHFQITGTSIPCGGGVSGFPYPVTENWQKTIGAHVIWLSGDVTAVPGATAGDPVQFQMRMTLHAEDRYNFNPGAHDIATGAPDSANGVFEITGLAHQYMNYSTLARTVTWAQGTVAGGSGTRDDHGRDRQPGDNRRLRNRV